MGDLGEGQKEYEFEPVETPGVPEPVTAPVPEVEPVKEPVHV